MSMRILRLQASNIKRLKVVDITPAGDVVMVTGANDQGKSSVLDSIWYCLGGEKALPSTPMRTGSSRASIELDLGDIKVTRKFTAAGNTSLIVADAAGNKLASPQAVLDRLTGALSFDPLAFLNKAPAQQLETLRKLVKLDVDIDQLAADNAKDYAERTLVNREAERQKALAASIVVPPGAPTKPVNIDAIQDQIAEASDFNARVADAERSSRETKQAMDEAFTRAKSIQARVRQLREEAFKLEREAAAAELEGDELRTALHEQEALPNPVDTRELSAQLDAALEQNKAYDALQKRKEASSVHAKLEAQADALTESIKARDAAKTAAIERAQMPVKGLSFGDGEVLYSGLPLNQAAKSIRLRISTAIAAALNPKLRVILIHDGSLIDPAGMAVLRAFAREQDMQIWVEQVNTSGLVGIVLEDGSVVADNQATDV